MPAYAHADIVEGTHDIHQFEVLMDHADAVPDRSAWRGDIGGLAVDPNRAAVGPVYAGQHVHECALARAVLAEQGVDLAEIDAEADSVIGDNAAKRLGYVFHSYGSAIFHFCLISANAASKSPLAETNFSLKMSLSYNNLFRYLALYLRRRQK
jgi:stage V sporulation protein SpoVS